MVAQEEISQQSDNTGGGAFGKFKQTLSSSLLTAQDKGKDCIIHFSLKNKHQIKISILF